MNFSISGMAMVHSTPSKNVVTPIRTTRHLSEHNPIITYELLQSGPGIVVNDNTDNTQKDSCLSILSNGQSLISWATNTIDARYYSIASKLFEPNLQNGQSELILPLTNPSESDVHPRTATLPDSHYALISDDTDDVYLRLFDQNRTQLTSPILVNDYTSSNQEYPDITASDTGTLFIAWDSGYQDGSADGIYSSFYDKEGTQITSEFRVNTYTANQQEKPSVTLLSNEDLSYVWTCQDSSLFGVCGKIMDQSKNIKKAEYSINTYTVSSQYNARQTSLNDQFAVTWVDKGQQAIYVKLISNTGVLLSDDIQVSLSPIDVNSRVAIATLSGGDGFVIAYGTSINGDYGVSLQVFTSDGEKMGSEVQVNDAPLLYSANPSIGVQDNGNIILTYTGNDGDSSGVFAKTFTPVQTTPPSSAPSSSPSFRPTISHYPTSYPSFIPTTSYPSSWPSGFPTSSYPSSVPSTSTPTTTAPSWGPTTSIPTFVPSLSLEPTTTFPTIMPTNTGGLESNSDQSISGLEMIYILAFGVIGIGIIATVIYALIRCVQSSSSSDENSVRHREPRQSPPLQELELEMPRRIEYEYVNPTEYGDNKGYNDPPPPYYSAVASAPPLPVAYAVSVPVDEVGTKV